MIGMIFEGRDGHFNASNFELYEAVIKRLLIPVTERIFDGRDTYFNANNSELSGSVRKVFYFLHLSSNPFKNRINKGKYQERIPSPLPSKARIALSVYDIANFNH